MNVAEAGLGAAVAARAERMSPRLGQSKYFVGFWLELPRFKLANVRVQADSKTYEGPRSSWWSATRSTTVAA